MSTPDEFIADSSVLIDYRSGIGFAKEIFVSAVEQRRNIVVSTVTISNIWALEDFDRKLEIGFSSLLQFLKIVSLDYDKAREAGHLMRGMATKEFSPLEVASVAVLAKTHAYRVISSKPNAYNGTGVTALTCKDILQS